MDTIDSMVKKRAKSSKKASSPSSSKKAAPKSSPIKFLGYAIALALIGYIVYSVFVYLGSVETTEEFLVCDEGVCIKSFHIHVEIEPMICGELKWFSLEHGMLEEQHTHKDRNRIHFHERLRVTPDTYEVIDTTLLTLRNFMGNMEPGFDGTCSLGQCEGTPCPGSDTPGSFSVIVNGEERPEKWDYVWKNGDDIEIIFE